MSDSNELRSDRLKAVKLGLNQFFQLSPRSPTTKKSDVSATTLCTVDETEVSMNFDECVSLNEIPESSSSSSKGKPTTSLSKYLTSSRKSSPPSSRHSALINASLQSPSSSRASASPQQSSDEDSIGDEGADMFESEEYKEGDYKDDSITEFSLDVEDLRTVPSWQQESYSRLPQYTWKRQSYFSKDGEKKINFVPVQEDEEHEHSEVDITLKDLKKQRLLGEGMYGQVWLVTGSGDDTNKPRPYALKVQSKFELAEEDKIEFVVREKEIMEEMRHPFIIRLIKAFQDTHFIYLVMDFVKGGELWSLMHPQTETSTMSVVLPEPQAKFYAMAIADAIAYVHRFSYAYRDIKPENILIDAVGYPVLIDFGLAKKLAVDEKTYTMVGTPSYCSPELVNAEGHDRSTDHWALGILIYEMLTASNPFSYEGVDEMSLYRSIAEEDYAPPRNVSEDAVDIISKLLIKDPTKRLGRERSGEVLEHPWFQGMDLFAMRRRQVPAPWIPSGSDPLDTSHFEDWTELADKSTQSFPRITLKDESMFDSFAVTEDRLLS